MGNPVVGPCGLLGAQLNNYIDKAAQLLAPHLTLRLTISDDAWKSFPMALGSRHGSGSLNGGSPFAKVDNNKLCSLTHRVDDTAELNIDTV